jgi:Recombination endonuclease VII
MPYADKEKQREYYREYQATHRDASRQNAKRYRESNRESLRRRSRAYAKANPGKRREAFLKHRYGLTNAAWGAIFFGQDHRCAICRTDSAKWVTDHDHVTDEIRGILCNPCNISIGLMKDNPEALRRAAEYLEQSR